MAVQSRNLTAPDRVPLRRALISVSDKTGIVEFAAALAGHGVETRLDRRHCRSARRPPVLRCAMSPN